MVVGRVCNGCLWAGRCRCVWAGSVCGEVIRRLLGEHDACEEEIMGQGWCERRWRVGLTPASTLAAWGNQEAGIDLKRQTGQQSDPMCWRNLHILDE